MTDYQVLLLCGGGGAEHEISLLSAEYLASQLAKIDHIKVLRVEMRDNKWIGIDDQQIYHLGLDGKLRGDSSEIKIDYVIPCIHGYPGETGDIQSLLEMANLPYLGCDAEASILCFNKITSKLWFDAIGIANTPYQFLTSDTLESHRWASKEALTHWGEVFIKAACQGSSVGCYHVTSEDKLHEAVDNAFKYSSQVLIEKALKPRELEVAAYMYNGELQITKPGEILGSESGEFYTYDEKYSSDSHTSTTLEAEDLTAEQHEVIKKLSHRAFIELGLKDLSRIDFFLTDDGEVLLNEINTFPGMTPISMFPKLLEHNGHNFTEFLRQALFSALENK